MNKKNKIINIIFIIILIILSILVLLKLIFFNNKINYYENRSSYQFPKLNINNILNKEFQNKIELYLSDQIPLSVPIKKIYNFKNGIVFNTIADITFKNNCQNRYINLGNSITSYGCNKNLVALPIKVNKIKSELDIRIDNINKIIDKTNIPVFIYYIEKDIDINFTNNNKSGIYEYLKNNINSNNISRFKLDNFKQFNKQFYKTDHHWNYRGAYLGYLDLVKLLTKDEAIKYNDKVYITNKFSGSKANFSGARHLYKEEFYAYKYNIPKYDIYINGKNNKLGNEEYYYKNINEEISYGGFYGFDFGEIIIDNKDNNKDNILIIGDSFDNSILKLLASHYNKTFAIDLRNYELENNKKFNYLKYIEENKIDKVLLIGNMGYFHDLDFNMEV